MKKILLKFNSLGLENYFQAYVKIYDKNNNLIYEGKTYNGELSVCLKKCQAYSLSANLYGLSLLSSFYVNNNDVYLFSFNSFNNETNTITFLLTDSNYSNLPIERGELLLWQR